MRNGKWAAVTATAVAVALSTTYAGYASTRQSARTPPPSTTAGTIAWHPCAADATADCTTLRRPVDPSDPAQTFEMAVARRKATGPGARLGVLIVDPGGPGASGADTALSIQKVFPAVIQQRFDVVGFDRRGINNSQAVNCSAKLVDAARTRAELPGTPAQFDALVAANKALHADCLRRNGPLTDHVDTAAVATDMDALRAALGEDKINFYGVSYGTLLGQQYAERYGQHIRAMVLDGNMNHRLTGTAFATTAASATEDSLNEFADWCAQDTTATCALHGTDVRKTWDRFLAAADQGRLINQQGDATSADSMIGRLYSFVAHPEYGKLAAFIADHSIGTPSSKPTPPGDRGQGDGANETLADAGRTAVLCQDWDFDVRTFADARRRAAAERAAAPSVRYSSETRDAWLSCIGWTDHPANPPQPITVHPDTAKILLTNPLHDPVTGYSWARSVQRQMGEGAVLLTYDGQGHAAYLRGQCMINAVNDYLVAGAIPNPGTHCPAEPLS